MANESIRKLNDLASSERRIILGLMSGTSLDGLDMALCEIAGFGFEMEVEIKRFTTVAYTQEFRDRVKTVFSKEEVSLMQVCLLHEWIGMEHAKIIVQVLAEWGVPPHTVDLIASHGQTIYHAPRTLHQLKGWPNGTLQIGDGDHIAVGTGIITISDFRQKHLSLGGEGAPLAGIGDFLLFSSKVPRCLVNIGGIANFTFLPPQSSADSVICSDIGPGNTLMDAYIRRNFAGMDYDVDGQIARQGTVNLSLLSYLNDDRFFSIPFPRTTGPEYFSLEYLDRAIAQSGCDPIKEHDVVATLNRFTADLIVRTVKELAKRNQAMEVYLSGGGTDNPVLYENIEQGMGSRSVFKTDALGIPSATKESVLFAVLANELCGGVEADRKNGILGALGKISFPN